MQLRRFVASLPVLCLLACATEPGDPDVASTAAPVIINPIEGALSCNGGNGVLGEVPLPPFGLDLDAFRIPSFTFPDTLCNDGSEAVLYFRPGRGAGIDHWLIELEGGGSCGTAQECADRYCSEGTSFGRQQMGSDDYYNTRPTIAAIGSQSITQGPFLDFNHVFIHYCSSDGWVGTSPATTGSASDPITGAPVTFATRFNGNAIVSAVLRILRRDGFTLPPFHTGVMMPDLDDATGDVVIAGGSAGGVGVILQLDRIATTVRANHNPMRQPAPTVVGLIDSAFSPAFAGLSFQLTDPCTTNNQCSWQGYVTATRPYYTRLGDDSCTTRHPPLTASAFQCDDFTHVVRNHVTTRYFLRQGERDSLLSWLYTEEKFATSPNATTAMTTADFASLVRQQAEIAGTITEEPALAAPGVFVPDCVTHDPLNDNAAMFGTTIGSTSWATTWRNWRAGTSPSQLVSDSAIPNTASVCMCAKPPC